MHYVRRSLKNTVAFLLFYSGLLSLIASVRLRNRAVVLMYHRVIPESRKLYCHSSTGIVIQESTFRMHLAFLQDHFRILNLDEFIECLERRKSLPDKSCLITFDDGWIDNYQTAYPILREYGVPATVFLPYDFIGTENLFWQEELNMRLSGLVFSNDPSDHNIVKRVMKREDIPTQYQLQRYIQDLKGAGYETITAVLDRIRQYQSGGTLPEHDNRYINWRQIKEMHEHEVSFGSHCMSHRMLTHLSAGEKRTEIVASKALLGTKLGVNIDTIAYPNGNFDDEVIALSREAGYKLGFTTKPGYVSTGTHRLSLPRISIHEHAAQSKARLLCRTLQIF